MHLSDSRNNQGYSLFQQQYSFYHDSSNCGGKDLAQFISLPAKSLRSEQRQSGPSSARQFSLLLERRIDLSYDGSNSRGNAFP